MRTGKKILSILLAVLLLVNIGVVFASAMVIGWCGDGLRYSTDEQHILWVENKGGAGRMDDYDLEGLNPSPFTYQNLNERINKVSFYANVKHIGNYAFTGRIEIESLHFSASTSSFSFIDIGEAAFYGCTGLVNVSSLLKYTDNIGAYAFTGCSQLEKAFNWAEDSYVGSIGDYAFAGCNVSEFPKSFDYLSYIGVCAFESCGLRNITIPGGVGTVKSYSFANNFPADSDKDENRIKIQEGVTKIEKNAFEGFGGLPCVELPVSLTSIGENAFASSDSAFIQDVFYAGTQEQWNRIAIASGNEKLTGARNIHFLNGNSGGSLVSVYFDSEPRDGGIASIASGDDGYYYTGETVTITAKPYPGYKFVGWYKGDTLVSTDATYTFVVTGKTHWTARFAPLSNYTVNVKALPANGGTVTGGGTYVEGTAATLTATANEGWEFVGWFKDGSKVSDNASYAVSVADDKKTFTAKFEKLLTYTVTVNPDPANGGTVTGGGGFEKGATTTLTATPNPGYHFVGFIDETGERWGNLSPTISVTKDMTFTAKFVNVAAMPTIKFSTDTLNDGDWYFDKDALIAAFVEGFHLTTEEASGMLADVAIAKYDPQSGIVVLMDASGDIDGAIVALPDGDAVYDLYKAGIKQYHAPSGGDNSGNQNQPDKPGQPDNPGGGNDQPTNTNPDNGGQSQGKVCKYCGGTHTGFLGFFVGLFHSILALFGLRKK